MCELYGIDKDYDDIELFDKYNMWKRILICQINLVIFIYISANGDYHSNIINDWYQNIQNPIESYRNELS